MTCTIKLLRIFNGTSPGGKQHRDETVSKLLHDLDCLSETLHFSSSSTDHVQPALKKTSTSLKRQKITPDKKNTDTPLAKDFKARTDRGQSRYKNRTLSLRRRKKAQRRENRTVRHNKQRQENSKIGSRQETRAIDTY